MSNSDNIEPPKGSYKASIYNDYARVFPDINERLASYEVRKTKAPVRRRMLKDFDPDMFVSGYKRFCAPAPTILETQEEYNQAVAEGRDVMIFPLYGEGGRPRRAYVSDRPKFPYVGLRPNTLSNHRELPYLPCCFAADQSKNPNRPRYKYEHQGDMTEMSSGGKRSHRPNIFLSNMAMKRDNYGMLPPLVEKFLVTLDRRSFPVTSDQPPFVRQGTIKDRNSVLDALVKVMIDYWTDLDDNEERAEYKRFIITLSPVLAKVFDGYNSLDTKEMGNYLNQIRKSLVSLVPANTTVQSTFNLEIKTIQDQLVDNTSYMDVKLFWRILEEVFHVNIILFQINSDHPQGVLASPVFLQEYLQYQRRKETSKWRFTVLLFETVGGAGDLLEYPYQVELIKSFSYDTYEGKLRTIIFSWFNESRTKVLLGRIQKSFNEIFSYDGHLNLPIANVFISKPLAQCSDFYGKIRLIQFANGVCIMTEPLPPIDAAELQGTGNVKCAFVPILMNKAQAFLAMEGVTDVRKVLVGDRIVGLQCRKETSMTVSNIQRFVSFYIPVIAEDDTLDVPTAPVVAPSFIASESLLEGFNRLARLARYIIEYVLWTFSRWHREHSGDIQDNAYIQRFAAEKFKIKNGHIYPQRIPRRLDGGLAGVLSGGKIVVPSVDVRNRLIFALQIKITQNVKEVVGYYSRAYIARYYLDVTDFEAQDSTIILFGQEMVLSWIKSKLPSFILHDRVFHPYNEEDEKEDEGKEDEKEDEKDDEEKAADNDDPEKLQEFIDNKNAVIEPYFVCLKELDEDAIYIAQPSSGLANALYICQTWHDLGFNVGPNDPGKVSTDTPFIFVAYNNAYDYTVKAINGEGNAVVLQYKVEEEIFTLALLRYNS